MNLEDRQKKLNIDDIELLEMVASYITLKEPNVVETMYYDYKQNYGENGKHGFMGHKDDREIVFFYIVDNSDDYLEEVERVKEIVLSKIENNYYYLD